MAGTRRGKKEANLAVVDVAEDVLGLGRGLVHKEGGDLHLGVGVEADEADEAVGVGFLAVVDLLQHLARLGAAEHGQLPHGPEAVVVVAGLDGAVEGVDPAVGVGEGALGVLELDAGHPRVADHVVDLAHERVVVKRRQVGEGLEELCAIGA